MPKPRFLISDLCFPFSFVFVVGLVLSVCGCGTPDRPTAQQPHIEVSLLTSHDTVDPTKPHQVGLHFKPEPGWHVYWKNPGDSGLAPQLKWSVEEEGAAIGDVQWPYPRRIPVGHLINFGYEGELLLASPLSLSASTPAGRKITISLKAKWLVCHEECIPGSAELTKTITVGNDTASQDLPKFNAAQAEVPKSLNAITYELDQQDDRIILSIVPADGRKLPQSAYFFPEQRMIIDNSGAQVSDASDGPLRIVLKQFEGRQEPIKRLKGVLFSDEGWGPGGQPKAVEIDTDPSQATPAAAAAKMPLPADSGTNLTFFAALGLAFIGGLLLNLMPCVFPVISIKILSFLEHARGDTRCAKIHAWSFTAGVVASFLLLAAILLGFKAGGEELGWGFQLQSPSFVIAMLLVFLILGVTFLLELPVGQTIQSALGRIGLPSNYLGSFFNGFLATAVATPCTAPFLGAAIPAALAMPVWQAITVFAFLGLGMGLPYLVLSYSPRLLAVMPKPGRWMETLKQFMSFPLFGTVIYLAWVFGRQLGIPRASLGPLVDLGIAAVVVSFGLWSLSRSYFSYHVTTRRISRVAAFLAIGVGVWFGIPSEEGLMRARMAASAGGSKAAPETDEYGLRWEHYSEALVTQLLKEQKPVYIDFTAAWCTNCQVNKKVVFGSEAVRAALAKHQVVLVEGDWTTSDPLITQALKKYGRNGVPLNVLYLPGRIHNPIVFPSLMTPGMVVEALEGSSQQK